MISLPFRPNRILIDIDTQRDLIVAGGAASVSNHKRILATIRRVMAAARFYHIPVISTAQVYSASGHNPGFCLAGTAGFKKISYTIRSNCICYPSSDSTDLPSDLLKRYDQVVFCKRCCDPFCEPRLDRMLTEMKANEFYLMGATTEGAVKATAMGLLSRGKNVTILTDVVGYRNHSVAARALREMKARGACLVKADDMLGSSMHNNVRTCRYKRCRGNTPSHLLPQYSVAHR